MLYHKGALNYTYMIKEPARPVHSKNSGALLKTMSVSVVGIDHLHSGFLLETFLYIFIKENLLIPD